MKTDKIVIQPMDIGRQYSKVKYRWLIPHAYSSFIMTEDEILETYYNSYCIECLIKGITGEKALSKDSCIKHYVITHFAEKIV